MSNAKQIQEANADFVSSRTTGQLPLPPARKLAIVTCMDARIVPYQALGIKEGDSHVIRNAGGRAPEALRSLIISQQLLATTEIVLIQHTDCGMLTFTTEQARGLVSKNLNLEPSSQAHKYIQSLDFLDFPDLEKNVKEDVEFLRSNELIANKTISGFVYDVGLGKLKKVA
ncbi:hypothetical protein EX895_003005 [Sporisorium graminicola]|uniref:Carbonic anhydrase n=1 Tax=Sporisorium graminicola TaxID=280036 RepID=A0A4V6EVK2_9BASI|nr:hypothetical protein EX895_003005 [Sporisorium graminicola]TKY87909.1 hypothetical protein EX895_003005 [Sporisorium graminicola]